MKSAIVVVAIVAVAVGVYGYLARSNGRPLKPAQASAPSPPSRVSALGRLAPRDEVINVSAPEGDRLARLTVREGQFVEAGDILAYLDSYAERIADRDRIASQVAEAEARLVAETAYQTAVIAEARARLVQLETLLRLEISAQEARAEQLNVELGNTRREHERITFLRDRELVAPQDLDRQLLALRRGELELAAARVVLEKARQAHEHDVRVARAQLDTAERALTRAQRAIEVASLREAHRLAETRADRAMVRAPVTGQIFRILRRPGEETGTKALLQMGDVAHMYAVAEVYETDLSRVRAGHKATITSPALERPLRGTVELVGRSIAKNLVLDVDPAAAADRRVAEVKIRLDDSQAAARLVNLQVTVDIEVGGS